MKRQRQEIKRAGRRTPAILIAGLPHSIFNAIANVVSSKFDPARVICTPSGNEDNNLYRLETVRGLLRALSDYAVRQIQASQSGAVSPSQIVLAYVPADDEEHLLREFDFCVFPIRLTLLSEFHNGRQRRHDRAIVERYVIASLETALSNFNQGLMRRLSSPSCKDPIFLPPRNFRVSGTDAISSTFMSMRRGEEPWGTQFPNVQRVKATHEDLPRHVPNGASKEMCFDFRNLFFPEDRSNHGSLRELDANSTDSERIHFLRAVFRFGVPLNNGYHHDVQFGSGKTLGGTMFECSREGTVKLGCGYANVYPNDFVRPGE